MALFTPVADLKSTGSPVYVQSYQISVQYHTVILLNKLPSYVAFHTELRWEGSFVLHEVHCIKKRCALVLPAGEFCLN